jgi:hypothetical protein
MPQYQVNIELDSTTLAALKAGNFQMQVYKGAKTTATGFPVVWFTLTEFSSVVSLYWETNYGGYFSNTIAEPKATVVMSTSSPMNLGDVFTLETDGSGVLSSGGPVTAYSFESDIQEQWTCGLTATVNGGQPSAICAFPQYATMDNLIEPYEMILILFTQTPLNTGSVVETAVSQSVSMTLSPSDADLSVSFNINKGWDTQGSPYAIVNAPNFELAPALIIPPPSADLVGQGKINVKKKITTK